MRSSIQTISRVCALALAVAATTANAQSGEMEIKQQNPNGTPGFVTGDLGSITAPMTPAAIGAPNQIQPLTGDSALTNSALSFLEGFIDTNYAPRSTDSAKPISVSARPLTVCQWKARAWSYTSMAQPVTCMR